MLIEKIPGPKYLYAVQTSGFTKIGIAKSVEARLREMALMNPLPVTVFRSHLFSRDTVRLAEVRAHDLLQHCHHAREWFRVDDSELTDVLDLVCREAYAVEKGGFDFVAAQEVALALSQKYGIDQERHKAMTLRAVDRWIGRCFEPLSPIYELGPAD